MRIGCTRRQRKTKVVTAAIRRLIPAAADILPAEVALQQGAHRAMRHDDDRAQRVYRLIGQADMFAQDLCTVDGLLLGAAVDRGQIFDPWQAQPTVIRDRPNADSGHCGTGTVSLMMTLGWVMK